MAHQGGTNVHQIPELLNIIFSFADPQSNATNAQVCKKWSDIALDVLWREVNDLAVLFGLLAPIKVVTGRFPYTTRKFVRSPKASDWKRFEMYGKRVRCLTYKGPTQRDGALDQSIFSDVARTRTQLEILPNMHTLNWTGSVELCVLFMHKGVKDFALNPPSSFQTKSLGPFLEDLPARMPNIIHIRIGPMVPIEEIETEMVDLISRLPKIQNVMFPFHYVTTRVTEALSKLQNLEAIDLEYGLEGGPVSAQDIFSPVLEAGAFPKLRDLSATLLFNHVANFLDASNAPTNLATLFIDSPLSETPNDIHRLLGVIAENCKLLTGLNLYTGQKRSSPTVLPSKDMFITIDIIKPIFKLSNLTEFEIIHQYPLVFEKEDINLFASSCPSLETLHLNPEPLEGIKLGNTTLTLDDLLPFARHCPKLKSLGLFIDATTIDSVTAVHSLHVPVEFKSLEQLSVGMSFINDENAVALYLSQILPLNCRVHADVAWEVKTQDPHLLSVVKARTALWCGVAKLLPALTQLRMAQRVRTRELELELANVKRTALSGCNGQCQCQSECCTQGGGFVGAR